jgi:hypothetical protein
MRKLYGYFRTYWIEEVKLPYLLFIIGFLSISILLEYRYNLTSSLMNPYKGTIIHFYTNIVFYSLPILVSVLGYILFYKRNDLIKTPSFWFILLFIISAYAFRSYFYQYKNWIIAMNNGVSSSYLIKCSNQFFRASTIFLAIFIFWVFSGYKGEKTFYGFKLKGIDTKPYFILLLLMLPLIALASTQADFLNRYPTFANFVKGNISNSTLLARIGVYEILYGLDYVAVELFFRGFVLYTLTRFLGKGAIIPMVTMYVFIHFGKPLGETISSFFGGMILGIIAYETKSIIGGIIVHCGIAYLMEIGGFLGNLLSR